MGFCVLIPARLASTRLPDKPLADIGGQPMVVRVAQRASASSAEACGRRRRQCRDRAGVPGPRRGSDPDPRPTMPSGSDRLAEACDLLGLAGQDVVVNVQGDEPLIEPALIDAVAAKLQAHPEASMSTAAHRDRKRRRIHQSERGEGRARCAPASPSTSAARRCPGGATVLPQVSSPCRSSRPLRHVGIYGYRADFLRLFPRLPQAPIEVTEALEQLRALWHGHRIAVQVTASAPGAGVDTPEDLERVRAAVAHRRVSRPKGPACYPFANDAQRLGAARPARSARPTSNVSEDFHETDFVGRARRRKRHASFVHLPEVRHSANLHRRHAARGRQGGDRLWAWRPGKSWSRVRW